MISQMPQQFSPQPGAEAPIGPTGPTSPPTVGGLLGPQGAPSQGVAGPSPTPEQHVESILGQFRQLSTQVQALARQYPPAAQDLAVCNDSLINAMTKIVSSLSAESSSAPQMLA